MREGSRDHPAEAELRPRPWFGPVGWIGATNEAAGATDEHLGRVFRNMRRVLGITAVELARRLGTDLGTIAAFEGCAVSDLPPESETERIVYGYAALLRVSPEPIVARLQALRPLPVRHVAAAPRPPTRLPGSRRIAEGQASGAPLRQRSRTGRRLMAVTTPLVLVSLGGAAFVASPSSRELDQVLPARVQEAIEFARHRLTGMSVRRADGLTWIDVADPRTRKADKLPPTER